MAASKVMKIIGAALTAIMAFKFSVIGYYPDELVPYAVVGGIGVVLLLSGQMLGDRPSKSTTTDEPGYK